MCACGGQGGEPDASPADAPPGPVDAALPDAEPAPAGTNCFYPYYLDPGDSHDGDATDFLADRTASCSGGSSEGPDFFYRILPGPIPIDLIVDAVVTDTGEPPYDLAVSARTNCFDYESEIACSDQGFGDEHIELLGISSAVTVIVDGTSLYGGRDSGTYTLYTRVRDIVGENDACDPAGQTSRCIDGWRCVAGTCVEDSPALACSLATDMTATLEGGVFDVIETTSAHMSDYYQSQCAFEPELRSPEHIYRFDLTTAADLFATTDFAETEIDTVLYLLGDMCGAPEIACNSDVDRETINLRSTLDVSGLEPGTYYLVVDGESAGLAVGTYRLQVDLN